MDGRARLSRPQCAQDWEDRKAIIMELYESNTLKETMKTMEEERSFKATEKQYKKQLQKWDIDHKRIKPTEYKAMIRKKRQREEDGHKDSKFQLRGVEIDDAKIVRFQKRHRISEPEQVSDCPTPTDLICTTPAPIPPSPGLRPFPWYNVYEKYLDLSMTGSSTIQPNDMRSLLHSLIVPFHDYEAQCRFRNGLVEMQYDCLDLPWRKWGIHFFFQNYLLVDVSLCLAVSAFKIPNRIFEIYHSQRLLGLIISKYLDCLDNRSHSLPSLDPSGQLLVLSAVRIAGTMYRVSGRRGEAISLLETVIHLVEQDLDLKNAIIWFFYNEMLLELAHCYAEEGHRDEARHVLNKQLTEPPNLEKTVANMRRSRTFGVLSSTLVKRKLRKNRRDSLQLVGRLENGRADTVFTQEHHSRLQEGFSQPGTSEWGPFLTDRVDWNKV